MEKSVTKKRARKISKQTRKRPETSRRRDKQLSAEARRLEAIQRSGMYPLGSPGMPLPGPNFLRHAQDLGDESELVKVQVACDKNKSGKRTETVAKIGSELERLHLRALREPGFTLPIEMKGNKTVNVEFVPGHIWGQHQQEYAAWITELNASTPPPVDGPHPANVMVIGKMPWHEELSDKRNLVGPSGQLLFSMLKSLQVKGMQNWYITNLLKFVPPDGTTSLKAAWLKDCRLLLEQELRIVRPKYILCLGADSSKALLGSKFNVSYMEGRVVEHTFQVGMQKDSESTHTSLVMTVVHPAQVLRDETQKRTLERGCARFNLLKNGVRFDKEEQNLNHITVRTLAELEEVCQLAEFDPQKKDSVVGVDAEWHGEHPINKGSYLRTIQFAWLAKHACGVVLAGPGGKTTFVDSEGKPALKRGIRLLSKYLNGGNWKTENGDTVSFRPKRVVGHFFNADLEWLVHYKLDVRDRFAVPLYDLDLTDCKKSVRDFYRKKGFKKRVLAWERTRYEGGADTGLMSHAIEETASYKLESLAMRYTTAPRYDVPLHDWREAYCKENDIKSKDLEGYGMCPDDVLLPYGIYDADVTLRLYYEFHKMLDNDYEGNCCREAFWESMIAAPSVLEIHQSGILVDRDRIDYLTERFIEARRIQEEKIKKWAHWPDFNIRSVQQVKEFLFGEDLNGKVTATGQTVRIRPKKGQVYVSKDKKKRKPKKDARSLYVEPLIDTNKPPNRWEDIVSRGKESEHSPSTNKMVLAILAQQNEKFSEQINWIRDYRFLDQVLKTLLRPPEEDSDGNWLYDDSVDSDNYLYSRGLASCLCDDGRVRTHIYQTKETGRWASARPNLQNISKQRDPDYTRLLGAEGYKYKLRSVLKAAPGHAIVEADYTGAELYGMAIMSGDKRMIDHATRNQLPEDHPQFYDIHSNVARLAFGLKCEPTKSGLKAIGKSHLRIIAKSVLNCRLAG